MSGHHKKDIPKGLTGIAIWDHGQFNRQGVSYSSLVPEFYHRDIEFKLREYKYQLKCVELQQEAHYQDPGNHSWSDLDLMQAQGFAHFLLKSKFLSVHLRALDCDIACEVDDGHRNWSVRENIGGIDFGFSIGANCMAMHPGSWPSSRPWPHAQIAHLVVERRSNAFRRSMEDLLNHFIYRAFQREEEFSTFIRKHSTLVDDLTGGLESLRKGELEDLEYYRLSHSIMDLIYREKVPIWMVRRCGGAQGPRICVENVEPPNMLINTPAQMSAWYDELAWRFKEKWNHKGGGSEFYDRYRPRMLVDVNHFLNGQFIMSAEENHGYERCFPDYEDLFRSFIALPQENGSEALLNRFICSHRKDIAYYHIAGCNKDSGWMATHEPIQAFRKRMYMILSARGLPVPKYATCAFDSARELNMEEVIQLLGPSIVSVLEVFDCSTELVRSSQANVEAYLEFLGKETVRVGALIESRHPESAGKLSSAQYYMLPYQGDDTWKVGYQSGAFYRDDGICIADYDDETGETRFYSED